MKGGIYTNDRCPVCSEKLRHFEPNGVWCPSHPHVRAEQLVVRFGDLTKRFRSETGGYKAAFQFLTGVRFKTTEGSFDIRDYRRDNPLGFANLVDSYLVTKQETKAAYQKYRQRLRHAKKRWGNRNVKEIGYKEIELLLIELKKEELSSKYRYDILCCLRMFWSWLLKCREINHDQMPAFPEPKPKINLRKIIRKEIQEKVLEEIYRISWDFNPRIYIGGLFLATSINIRPNELRNIKEKHIDLDMGCILIPHPKEGYPKVLYRIEADIELLRQIPKGFPERHFFRHLKGNGNARPGQQFGKDYLWRWWRKACKNLKIEGVSLYPGTRHSTAVALPKFKTPEEIKRGMGTRSNKAFERYLRVTGSELRGLYETARGAKIIPLARARNSDNV